MELVRIEVAFVVVDAGDGGEVMFASADLAVSNVGFVLGGLGGGGGPEVDVPFSAHCESKVLLSWLVGWLVGIVFRCCL